MQAETDKKSRRRIERISLSIPVRVEGRENKDVSWSEMTHFHSISAFGAGFNLSHKVIVGQLLLLTTAFPTKLRCYDFSEVQYKVWTLVRHCESVKISENSKEIFTIGVAFLGKNPPVSHLENPSKRYLLSNFNKNGFCEISELGDNDDEPLAEKHTLVERRDERYAIPFEVFVEILDEKQNPIDHDLTFTENVSRSGSAIRTILNAQVGNYVKINPVGYDLSILAVVRNRRTDEDGISRLHLEFIDQQFPLDGIE